MTIQRLRRFLIHRLGDHALAYLKMQGLLQANKHTPAALWQPGGGRILVLAPHMDDEIIGCGGTLYRHLQQQAQVTVLFLTDGRYGGKLPANGDRPTNGAGISEAMIQARQAEARAALAELGAIEVIFLDNADGSLPDHPDAGGQVRAILERCAPEIVYLPCFLEEHPDHRAVNQILLAAADPAAMRFECMGYEVWTALFPNCLVDISTVVEVKRRALGQYQSQLAVNDYLHAALGLNAYRGIALASREQQYAEAFYAAPLANYLELYQLYLSVQRGDG
jgi:LmbE family N-acetylglucosaminyl deacetylase